MMTEELVYNRLVKKGWPVNVQGFMASEPLALTRRPPRSAPGGRAWFCCECQESLHVALPPYRLPLLLLAPHKNSTLYRWFQFKPKSGSSKIYFCISLSLNRNNPLVGFFLRGQSCKRSMPHLPLRECTGLALCPHGSLWGTWVLISLGWDFPQPMCSRS